MTTLPLTPSELVARAHQLADKLEIIRSALLASDLPNEIVEDYRATLDTVIFAFPSAESENARRREVGDDFEKWADAVESFVDMTGGTIVCFDADIKCPALDCTEFVLRMITTLRGHSDGAATK